MSARGRAKREAVRRQAAGWFAEDVSVPEIARRLRVSQTAVDGWRKRWRAGDERALASKGLVGLGAVWIMVGCGGWPMPWMSVRRRTGSVVISGGPWRGCRT
ncbi:helix-turn-helix domain-containing protein [Verrucosispora sp. TAA-831]|uniref:helix-turn-helix domain-containing protein n=1 Tax=Verrucosispora sp. TAA-831 TaxID=3422227 RepID=UPI003D6F7FC4